MRPSATLPVSASVAAALRAFVPEMRRLFGSNLRRIILFGSQARGEARPDSDVDVLLLFEELVGGKWAMQDQVIDVSHRFTLTHQALLAPVIAQDSKYETIEEPLFKVIHREGLVIMSTTIDQLMALAETTLKDAEVLRDVAKGYRSAVSRAYYAMFYATEALLASKQIEAKSHAGLVNQFGQQFVVPGLIEPDYNRRLQQAFAARQEGDYTLASSIDEAIADRTIQDARAFIDRVQRYLTDGAGQ